MLLVFPLQMLSPYQWRLCLISYNPFRVHCSSQHMEGKLLVHRDNYCNQRSWRYLRRLDTSRVKAESMNLGAERGFKGFITVWSLTTVV